MYVRIYFDSFLFLLKVSIASENKIDKREIVGVVKGFALLNNEGAKGISMESYDAVIRNGGKDPNSSNAVSMFYTIVDPKFSKPILTLVSYAIYILQVTGICTDVSLTRFSDLM
jgi:hypothetical protein